MLPDSLTIKEQAFLLYLRHRLALIDDSAIIQWADEQVARIPNPPIEIIDLSLFKFKCDAELYAHIQSFTGIEMTRPYWLILFDETRQRLIKDESYNFYYFITEMREMISNELSWRSELYNRFAGLEEARNMLGTGYYAIDSPQDLHMKLIETLHTYQDPAKLTSAMSSDEES